MKNTFIAADDLLLDAFRLSAAIHQSGFRPDFLVGLWRGGSAVGIAVQEGLEHFGVATDHIAVRTSYTGLSNYSQMVDKAENIRVHGLQYLLERVGADHSMLIVDDVYSSGSSVRAVINELYDFGRPRVVDLAVLVDRGGRELPIQASFAAAKVVLPASQRLTLAHRPDGRFAFSLEDKPKA